MSLDVNNSLFWTTSKCSRSTTRVNLPWSWSWGSAWCTWLSPECFPSTRQAKSPYCHDAPLSIWCLEEVQGAWNPYEEDINKAINHYSQLMHQFINTAQGGNTKQTHIHTYLLQFMMMSWGLMRRLSMPILGWSPRPRNRPGGSMRKLAIRSLWLSMIQKPYSCKRRSFSSFIFYKG